MAEIYSNEFSKNYLALVEVATDKRKLLFTQKEIAETLNLSNPTIINFEKGRVMRIDVLEQYLAMLCDLRLELHIR